MNARNELRRRAEEYAQRYGSELGDELGSGVHGTVFVTTSQHENVVACSAVKAHVREQDYCRERDVYLRLQEHEVRIIWGCEVPQMLRYDDELLVIEMTVVSRPFVLDFAGAFLDEVPDFPEEVLAEWGEEKREQFGIRWNDVQAVLRGLEAYGVYMVDVNPGNISFNE